MRRKTQLENLLRQGRILACPRAVSSLLKRLFRRTDAQDTVEYALLTGVICLVALAAVLALGGNLQRVFQNVDGAVASSGSGSGGGNPGSGTGGGGSGDTGNTGTGGTGGSGGGTGDGGGSGSGGSGGSGGGSNGDEDDGSNGDVNPSDDK